MRELKFRYWNPFANKLVYNPIVFKEGWTLEQYFSDRGWTWEQYTGLKDKNGKEIYEGDIVRYVSEGEGIYLAVIKRKDEDKEQSYWLTGFVYEPFATVDEEELTEEEYESLGGMEIIGNIHDNPELLKRRNNEYRNNRRTDCSGRRA